MLLLFIDNPSCTDQRSDCGSLLERTPTFCTQYTQFARLKCAKTCGICTNIKKGQIKIVKDH